MIERKSCALVERWIHLAVDGELSSDLDRELEAHLDECQACRDLSDQVWESSSLLDEELGQLGTKMDGLLDGRWDAETLPDAIEEQPSRTSFWNVSRVAALVVVAVGLTFAVYVGYQMTRAPSGISPLATLTWNGPAPQFDSVGQEVQSVTNARTRGLTEGTRVEVGDSPVRVEFPSGSVVVVSEGSVFRVNETDGGVDASGGLVWHLERGSALFTIERDGRTFVVKSETAVVEVVGTEFVVTYDPAVVDSGPTEVRSSLVGETKIEVIHGIVRIGRRDRASRYGLVAGESAVVTNKRVQVFPPSYTTRPGSDSKPPIVNPAGAADAPSDAGPRPADEGSASPPQKAEIPAESKSDPLPARTLDLPPRRQEPRR